MIPQLKTAAKNFMLLPILLLTEDSTAESPFPAQTAEQETHDNTSADKIEAPFQHPMAPKTLQNEIRPQTYYLYTFYYKAVKIGTEFYL